MMGDRTGALGLFKRAAPVSAPDGQLLRPGVRIMVSDLVDIVAGRSEMPLLL
jgi:hypothetical protein